MIIENLISNGVLNSQRANEIKQKANNSNKTVYQELLSSSDLNPQHIMMEAANSYRIPIANLDSIFIDSEVLAKLDLSIIKKYRVVPFFIKTDSLLYIAIDDPAKLSNLPEIKFHLRMNVKLQPVLAHTQQLNHVFDNVLGSNIQQLLVNLEEEEEENTLEVADNFDSNEAEGNDSDSDSSIIKLVQELFHEALKLSASDIHLESYEHYNRVRFRIDGLLSPVFEIKKNQYTKVVARIKILAKLDIAEKRVPQDGRIKMHFGNQKKQIDFRVSTMPILFGEKVVIRILDTSEEDLSLDKLGMSEEQLKLYSKAANQPYGMILVTGPTGSGKTVTLYSAINMLNKVDRNISSAEDPVEINLAGINQVNVNEKAGVTFALALKAFLRQDPDIIIVGEIRDLVTGEIAIKAAQTGHLVLSTLHTNDGPSTLSRLVNMGIAPFNIASAVKLIVSQRLVRKLCRHCKKSTKYPEETLIKLGIEEEKAQTTKFFKAVGCSKCTLGYKGRIGIFEVMPISEEMAEIIMKNGSVLDIHHQARKEGIDTMHESGIKQVLSGITTIEEVARVTTNE